MSKVRSAGLLCVVAALAVALAACGPKKNTALSRHYQAFITKYNIHYNGDTHYRETLHDMEQKYEDDYSRLVPLHPAEARGQEGLPQPTGDFKRSIEKAQKAIQLRSIKKRPARKSGAGANDPKYKAWLKRDEYNPFLHNDWMLMARSQYQNGDFLGAASTFYYVSRHFGWLPRTVLEAQLWQAQSYIALGWTFEGETILKRVKPDELTTSTLQRLYNQAWADLLIRQKEWKQAVPFLTEAARLSSGSQKTRLTFLLGQVYQRMGDNALAYKAFANAGAGASTPYRTKFNARIKQSEVFTGDNIKGEVAALRRMTRYDRNKEYLDQVHYAIGNLYLSRRDTAHAVEAYREAVKRSTRDGIDKALANLTLGGLYFDQRRYDLAQPCYAEAVGALPKDHPGLDAIKKRSDVLDELAVYAQNVTLQDSLLRLSRMTPEERLKVVNGIIDSLKRQKKEEEEAAALSDFQNRTQGQGTGLNQSQGAKGDRSFTLNSDGSWYFYNQSIRQQGKAEFQRLWGSRRLEDDWRRHNKTTYSLEEGEGGEAADSLPDADGGSVPDSVKGADDPLNPEFYLRQIPNTDDERATCHEIIQEGLYNMGLILKDRLEDYPAAMAQWQRLLREYPDNAYRLDVYYNIYLMLMRQGKTPEADTWRLRVTSDFPDSPLGVALRDPQYIEHLKQMDTQQNLLYDQAFQAYMAGQSGRVHTLCREMEEKYPLSPLMPKFMFIDALSYVGEHRPDQFNAVLKTLLERYPDADIAPIASSWEKGLKAGKKLSEGAANFRTSLWSIRLGADSLAAAVAADSLAFKIEPQSPQLLVLLYPAGKVSANALLYDVARFNFGAFVVKDFDLETMTYGPLGMLVIKGFDNQEQLTHYRGVMAAPGGLELPRAVRPIEISQANFDLLLKGGGSFEQYFRFINDTSYQALEDYEEAAVEEASDSSDSSDISDGSDGSDISDTPPDAVETPYMASPPETAQPSQPSQPSQPKAPKPAAPKPSPKSPVTPVAPSTPLPYYPPGSEGDEDDDLLNP